MAKQKKQPRPKAQTPKGFRDYFGAEVSQRAEMLQAIAGVYHRYGFDALESSAVETVEALGKFLPDVDRPNEGVFAWQEEDAAEAWNINTPEDLAIARECIERDGSVAPLIDRQKPLSCVQGNLS